MVYRKGDLSSLLDLDKWWQLAQGASQWNRFLVFSLWCNDIDNYADEIEPGHKEMLVKKWKIPPELVFDVSAAEDDGKNVKESYERVVKAVWEKCQVTRSTSTTMSYEGRDRHQSADSDIRIVLPDVTINNGNNIQQPPPTKKKCFC